MDERSSATQRNPHAARATPPNKPVRPARGTPTPAPAGAAAAAPAQPTILLVGEGHAFESALRAGLLRHHLYVETSTREALDEAVLALAPDLVLLVGSAADTFGSQVLHTLHSAGSSAFIPVALLADDTASDARLSAFRHSAAALIPKSASIAEIAERVAALSRSIPERGGESSGVIDGAMLSEFVACLEGELRSGILSIHTGGVDGEPMRLVLGKGRPLTAVIDDFVHRVKAHAVHGEALRYEFAEYAPGTLLLFDPEARSEELESSDVEGVRLVLADDDTVRADSLALELGSRGVSVGVTDLSPSEAEFATLRQIDPTILLIGEAQLKGRGYDLLRRMRRDARLRWVSLLLVRWEEMGSDAVSAVTLDRLEIALAGLSEADRRLEAWAERGSEFNVRLEATGPARCLRALVQSGRPLRVTIHDSRATLSLDLADELVLGASGRQALNPAEPWHGALALSALLGLNSGRVHVAPATDCASTPLTNLMARIDVALSLAEAEPSPILPSQPTPAAAEPAPHAHSRAATPSLRPLAALTQRAVRAVLGPSATGISLSAALFLTVLAVLQGLLIAAVAVKIARSGHSASKFGAETAPSASALASLPSSRATALNPGHSTGGAPIASPALVPPRQSEPSAEPFPEASVSTPGCAELLGSTNLREKDDPSAAYAAMKDAHLALVRGDLNSSERALCKAALWNRTNPAIPLELAQLMLLRRDGPKAVDWAERGLRLEPTSLRAQGILGDAFARTGAVEAAKAAWLKALQVATNQDEPWKALSFMSQREAQESLKRRDFARAERFYRRAAIMDPSNLLACNGVSDTLLKLGDTASALAWAKRTVSVAPRDVQARLILGEILMQRGDRADAEASFRAVLELEPTNFIAKLRLARLNLKTDR